MILVMMLASSLFVGCAAIAVAVGAAGAKLVDTLAQSSASIAQCRTPIRPTSRST